MVMTPRGFTQFVDERCDLALLPVIRLVVVACVLEGCRRLSGDNLDGK